MHGRVGGEGVCDRNSGEHSWVRVQGGMALGTARHGLVGHLLYGGRWHPATCRRTAHAGCGRATCTRSAGLGLGSPPNQDAVATNPLLAVAGMGHNEQ
jgi:hypothetical protein